MKNAETVNDLIEINNDRVEGYKRAGEETNDTHLHNLFTQMIMQSEGFLKELRQLVINEGEKPSDGTTIRGKIYRAWMEVKATFSGNDRQTVLNSCEFGEDAAQRAYDSALEDEDLTTEARLLIQQQKSALKKSHDSIKELRDHQVTV